MERVFCGLAGLPTDRDRDDFCFIVLREQTPTAETDIGYMLENMPECGVATSLTESVNLMYDINSPSESTDLINS